MSFSIEFGSHAVKFLSKLDYQIKDRLREKIEKLREDPFPQEVERVKGYKVEKVFRIRVGDYRILYIVSFERSEILVAMIDKRERAYD